MHLGISCGRREAERHQNQPQLSSLLLEYTILPVHKFHHLKVL